MLGAALYCVRTDIAYLMQNQKAITRHMPEARRHFLSEILQRTGHTVTCHQTDEWINEAVQKNIQDDINRTEEQKKNRIKVKQNKFLKSFGDGRESLNHYKSGGKKIKVEADVMQVDQEQEETEAYPVDPTVLKTFSIKGLRTITERVIQSAGGDIRETTNHIPTQGKGQKVLWLKLLHHLIEEHKLETLDVPIAGACKPWP